MPESKKRRSCETRQSGSRPEELSLFYLTTSKLDARQLEKDVDYMQCKLQSLILKAPQKQSKLVGGARSWTTRLLYDKFDCPQEPRFFLFDLIARRFPLPSFYYSARPAEKKEEGSRTFTANPYRFLQCSDVLDVAPLRIALRSAMFSMEPRHLK